MMKWTLVSFEIKRHNIYKIQLISAVGNSEILYTYELEHRKDIADNITNARYIYHKFEATQGKFSRYPYVDNDSIFNIDRLVIVSRLGDVGYLVSDDIGKVQSLTTAQVIQLGLQHRLANAKVVNNRIVSLGTSFVTIPAFDIDNNKANLINTKLHMLGVSDYKATDRLSIKTLNHWLKTCIIPNGISTIDTNTFRECTVLDEISMPNSVMYFGKNACYECVDLKRIKFSQNLIEIGDEAFANVHGIHSIILPDSLKILGDGAFKSCTSLEAVKLSTGLTRIGKYEFCTTRLHGIDIPSNIQTIDESAFLDCIYLETVNFHEGLIEINDSAFKNCIINTLKLPSGLKTIGCSAFSWCHKIESIEIPDSVVTIGEGAFAFCSEIKHLRIPNKLQEINKTTFEKLGITEIEIPENVKYIHEQAFASCWNLTEVIVHSGTKISKTAFSDCMNLKEIQVIKPNGKIKRLRIHK